jgi:hypothetical protein
MKLPNEREMRELVEAAKNFELTAITRLIEISTHDENARHILNGMILKLAIHANRLDIINILIHAGADVNFADVDGKTGLILAARLGRLDIVKALIAAGADVNLADRNHHTALESTMIFDNLHIFNALRRAGADISRDDPDVQDALNRLDALKNQNVENYKAQCWEILHNKPGIPTVLIEKILNFIDIDVPRKRNLLRSALFPLHEMRQAPIKMSFEDIFTSFERTQISKYITLLYTLQETIKKNSDFIQSIPLSTFISSSTIPSEEDINNIQQLIELVKTHSSLTPPPSLASLVQRNGLILKILDAKIINDPLFFGAVLRSPACDRNNDLSREYTRSYFRKHAPKLLREAAGSVIGGLMVSRGMGLSDELSLFISASLGATITVVNMLKLRTDKKPAKPVPKIESRLFSPSLESKEELKEEKRGPRKG